MVQSDFVFEEGSGIAVGDHGEHSFVYAAGNEVTDTGISPLVFEAGTGLSGFEVFYDISDWQDDSDGDNAGIDRIPKFLIELFDSDANFVDAFPSNTESAHTVYDASTSVQIETNTGDTDDFIDPSETIAKEPYGYVDYWEENGGGRRFSARDCFIYWGEDNLQSDGYIDIGVYNYRVSSYVHYFYFGENKNDGYFAFSHEADNVGWDFEGRMYRSGEITDQSGNVLGTWK